MNCHKIPTILLIALCFNCFSQHKLNANLGYGVSLVRQNLKETASGFEVKNKFGNSFLGGLGYKYQFKKQIGLGIDLSFSQIKGTTLYVGQGTATWTTPVLTYMREEKNDFKFNYITIPLYVSFYYKRFSLDFGAQGSRTFYREYSYSDKFIYSNGLTINSKVQRKKNESYLLKYDFGIFTTLNINIWKRLDIYLRYYQGLTNLGEDSGNNLKNRQIIIGVRYNLFVSALIN